jgi:hypothetical protein
MYKISEILNTIEDSLKIKRDSIDELSELNQKQVNKIILALKKKFKKKIPDNINFILVKDILEFYGIEE